MDIINLNELLNKYLNEIHPANSNAFIIRISDKISKSHNRRRSYILSFPIDIKNEDILKFWIEYAIINITETNLELVSIDPFSINKIFNEIKISLSGVNINPEDFIKNLSFDIIEKLNKHIIEFYMDNNYPDIDIDNPEYNIIFDNLDMSEIYETYPYTSIYIPLIIYTDSIFNVFIHGIIKSNSSIIDIIDELRSILDSDDINESFEYNKEEIIYKYGKYNETSFSIITDPDI